MNREQIEIRARINELENLPTTTNFKYGVFKQPYVTKRWLANRLSKLRQSLEVHKQDGTAGPN